jgi:hypothetical protein
MQPKALSAYDQACDKLCLYGYKQDVTNGCSNTYGGVCTRARFTKRHLVIIK